MYVSHVGDWNPLQLPLESAVAGTQKQMLHLVIKLSHSSDGHGLLTTGLNVYRHNMNFFFLVLKKWI